LNFSKFKGIPQRTYANDLPIASDLMIPFQKIFSASKELQIGNEKLLIFFNGAKKHKISKLLSIIFLT
jgi:hypothetical protein